MRNRLSFRSLLLLGALLGALAEGRAQSLLNNGSFDSGSWTGASAPTGWGEFGANPPLQSAGLVGGSTNSVWMPTNASGSAGLLQSVSNHSLDFQASFVFAAADPGASGIGLAVGISELGPDGTNGTRLDLIGLRLVEGSGAGMLSLQANSGGTWSTIAADAFSASAYNATTHTYPTLDPYTIQIAYSSASNTYSLSYGAGTTTTATISNIAAQNANNGKGLAEIEFYGNPGAGYGLDNVTLTATPEPGTVALLGPALGALLLAGRARRRVLSV